MLIRKLSLAVNLLVAVAVLAAWGKMVFAIDERGTLTAPGLSSLKYFTVLSNLLACAASLAYAACLVRLLTGGAPVPYGVTLLKYAGAVSVILTLLTVVLFLGPTAKEGFLIMFQGANLWFHLIVPLLCILDFCALNPDGPLPFAASLVACVPMALYSAYYLGNILANGVLKDGRSNDWYGFLRGGIPGGVLIALIIYLGTWGAALLMRLARK